MKVFKRYRNRKLYEPKSGYVSLSDIMLLVRKGEDVRVLDHGTERDRTGHVLAQAIAYEELRAPNPAVLQKLFEVIRLKSDSESEEFSIGKDRIP